MSGPNLWRAPPPVIAVCLERLAVTVDGPSHVAHREALAAHRLPDVVERLNGLARALWDVTVRVELAEVDFRVAIDEAPVDRGYDWVDELRSRLDVAQASGVADVRALRRRLPLRRMRRPRLQGLVDGLRVILPELRSRALPPGLALNDPGFLAEADALLPRLVGLEQERRDAQKAWQDALRERDRLVAEARQLVRHLFALVRFLSLKRKDLVFVMMDLRELEHWAATRPKRERSRATLAAPEGAGSGPDAAPPDDDDAPPGAEGAA